jgi:hypothetical protein
MAEKYRGLFMNTEVADCSIWESGLMIYDSLCISDRFEIDYAETDGNVVGINPIYDFYVFNHNVGTMRKLDANRIREFNAFKMIIVLEMRPNKPFVQTAVEEVFDAYCVIDPTMISDDKRVFAFPRPLDRYIPKNPYPKTGIPLIGSFGFATQEKGFDRVIDAVCKEFDEAIIRFNIPHGTHVPKRMTDALIESLTNHPRKSGIRLVITQDYMSKEDLIEWCGQNTLNIFLYHRDMAGLCATADQAISSGRPLAVSDNDTFRHIHRYLEPYPKMSLGESIALSQDKVLQMREDWSYKNFAVEFERMLDKMNILGEK